MNVTITPGLLSGTITPPPSKSQAHRVLIAAALADGVSVIGNLRPSRDISATLGGLTEDLGVRADWTGTSLTVTGIAAGGPVREPRNAYVYCGESGSTLRFLIPVALAVSGGGLFLGEGRLMERPLEPYFEIFREKGIAWSRAGQRLLVSGVLTPGTYRLAGDVSSQFITGLLFALPLLAGDSELLLTTPLESAAYVGMTLETLRLFGVEASWTGGGWHVPGNQVYTPRDVTLEGDWSQAAFYVAARGLGSALTIAGMDENSPQGDRVILEYENRLAGPGDVSLDVSGCPDLVPALAARAALRAGETTRIVNAARLRLKESDRLASVTAVLTALGADITEAPDSLTIRGLASLPGGVMVDSWNDHRIAMMAAVAATRCQRPVTITGAACVEKSYPDFWADYRALGGNLEVEP